MTLPAIILPESARHPCKIVERCHWKIRTFVERDAYLGYDYAGGYRQPSDLLITSDQIHAMNSAMRARSSIDSWKHFVGQPLPELQEIPADLDLIDAPDEQVQIAIDALSRLVRRIASEKWLTDMAASKALHLLRPRFVAISDSYVRECLGLGAASAAGVRSKAAAAAWQMGAVQRGMRELAQQNAPALDQLFQYANSLPSIAPLNGPFKGETIPVRLSKLRILDILLWSEVALNGPNPHLGWTMWLQQAVQSGAIE